MKILLLDRDGTLNVDKGRAPKPDDIALLPGVTEALVRFRDAGFTFFIVTNQGAVGDGVDTQENLDACHEKLLTLLREDGVHIERSYMCVHPRDGKCRCRKPEIGMWHDLLRDVPEAQNAERWMIGDKDGDVLFGQRAGCRTARILGPYPRTAHADCTVRSLQEFADCILPDSRHTRVMTLAEAADMADRVRKEGKKIVTTNGSFDLLHAGHRLLFAEARKQGDVLIVGVNSDSSVKRYKGNDRPVQHQDIRALHVARFADAVFVFDDDDPRPWLPVIRPNVHVNGAQYGERCVEAGVLQDIGARLVLVPIDPSLGSTTQLLASFPPAS